MAQADAEQLPALPGVDPNASYGPGEPAFGDSSAGAPKGGTGLPQSSDSFLKDAGIDTAAEGRASSAIAGAARTKLNDETSLDATNNARMNQDRQRMSQAYSLEEARADDPALKPWNADQERANRVRGPLEQFASVGTIFAFAASAFTKTPMVSALNAGAAAMNAIKQSDEAGYKSAYEAWKTNTDLALKRFDMERALYSDADKLMTTDIAAWKQKTEMIARQFEDHKTLAMAENGMIKEIADVRTAQAKAVEGLISSKERMEEFNWKHETYAIGYKAAVDQYKAEHNGKEPDKFTDFNIRTSTLSKVLSATKPSAQASNPNQQQYNLIRQKYEGDPDAEAKIADEYATFIRNQKGASGAGSHAGTPSDDKAKRDAEIKAAHPDWTPTQVIDERDRQIKEAKEAKPSMSKDGVDLAANLLIKGNPAATTNVGRGVQGGANLNAIKERAAEILKERGLSPEQAAEVINENTAAFMGDKRGATMLAGRTSQVIGASTVALNTMDRVLETSRKVPRTEFSDINKILLAGEQRTGDTNVIEYGIALNTLVNNYARAIGAGNNALTETARREAHELLQQYWSKGQIETAVSQMKKELHDELRGAQEARRIWQEGGSAVPGLGSGAATGTPKLPPVNLLKEGTITPFGDKGDWTLRNGKPVRVDQ